jgi:hypothetical protein
MVERINFRIFILVFFPHNEIKSSRAISCVKEKYTRKMKADGSSKIW